MSIVHTCKINAHLFKKLCHGLKTVLISVVLVTEGNQPALFIIDECQLFSQKFLYHCRVGIQVGSHMLRYLRFIFFPSVYFGLLWPSKCPLIYLPQMSSSLELFLDMGEPVVVHLLILFYK